MAAPRRLSDNVVLAPNPVLTTPQTSLVAIRCASKKSGGSSKNLGGRSPGKRYGFKKVEGAFVHAGNILATQRLIRWHPGAHVEMGCNKTLYALEDGTVRYTKEVYIPPPRSSESREVICRLPKGAVLYKTFISVDPTIEVESFKLVTSVLSQLAYPAGDTTPGASLNLPLKSLQSGCRSQRAIGVGAHSDALMRVHSAAHT